VTTGLKATVLTFAGVIVMASVWTGVQALKPGQWPAGTPFSLRLPRTAYEIPGMNRLVKWRASSHATEAAELGRWGLFGYGSGGIDFGLGTTCELLSYSRGVGNRQALPAWALQGLVGTVELRCPSSGLQSAQFAVVEMSCVIDGPDHTYSVAYNREIIRLRGRAAGGLERASARTQ